MRFSDISVKLFLPPGSKHSCPRNHNLTGLQVFFLTVDETNESLMGSSELQECGRPVFLPAERSRRVCARFWSLSLLILLWLLAGASRRHGNIGNVSVYLKTEELFKEERNEVMH